MSDQNEATRQFMWIYPPQTGQVAAFGASVVSANQAIDVAAVSWMRGRYCAFQADGGDVYILFGTSSGVTCDYTATAGVNQCMIIPNGQTFRFKVSIRTDTSSPTYFAYQSSSGTPKLRIAALSFQAYIPNP